MVSGFRLRASDFLNYYIAEKSDVSGHDQDQIMAFEEYIYNISQLIALIMLHNGLGLCVLKPEQIQLS